MLNFGELKTEVSSLIERPDSDFLTKIGRYLNQGYRHIYDKRPWMASLRQSTKQTVAGTGHIILPHDVVQVIDLHQTQTPIILALERYYNRLKKTLSSSTTTGFPEEANPMGVIGIKNALPSDGTITIESSDNNDITQVVRIQGFNTNGVYVAESLTINGTSAVTSSNSYSSKTGHEPQFSKDSDTAGIVTIKRSTTEIATIAPLEKESRYSKWLLFPTPSSAIDVYVTHKTRIRKLVNDIDVPIIECDNALVAYAYSMCLKQKRQFAKAREQMNDFEHELMLVENNEPQFQQNFNDIWMPSIQRDPIDEYYY